MASPFKQPEWSIEEAVLLAQASESAASDVIDSDELVRVLSLRLRNGAEAMGFSIGLQFRNNEEVKRNLVAITSIIKMLDYVEEEYFEGSSLGQAAWLLKKDKSTYHRILDSANEKYPVCRVVVAESVIDEPHHGASEPSPEYSIQDTQLKRRRPRIQRHTHLAWDTISPTSKYQSAQSQSSTSIDIESTNPGHQDDYLEIHQKAGLDRIETTPNNQIKEEKTNTITKNTSDLFERF